MTRSLLALVLLAAAPAVAADPAPSAGQLAYDLRHLGFEGLGKHMKMLSTIAKNESAPVSLGVAPAQAIQASAKAIPSWFPEGSGPDKVKTTEALPAIWKDAEGLARAARALDEAAGAAVAAAQAGDRAAYVAAVGAVGKSCGGCHDAFRKAD